MRHSDSRDLKVLQLKVSFINTNGDRENGMKDFIFRKAQLKDIDAVEKIYEAVLDLEEKYKALSDAELKGMTKILKDRLSAGETLDDILPDAFSFVSLLQDCPENHEVLGSSVLREFLFRSYSSTHRFSQKPFLIILCQLHAQILKPAFTVHKCRKSLQGHHPAVVLGKGELFEEFKKVTFAE